MTYQAKDKCDLRNSNHTGASWQTGLSMGNPIGQVIGALISAYPMELFGRKRTFGVCVVLTGGLVFIQFFARSLPVLLAGELLGGLVLGCYVVIAPAYASEVCPLALRGVLTSYTNLCFVMGQLLANGVTAGTSRLADHWAYSIPFALQWFWVAIIVPGMFFIPESPWWLVRRGRFDEAEHALRRLASKEVDVAATLAVITETDRLEQEIEAGSTYWDCFRSVNLRRTEISIGVYSIQVLSGPSSPFKIRNFGQTTHSSSRHLPNQLWNLLFQTGKSLQLGYAVTHNEC